MPGIYVKVAAEQLDRLVDRRQRRGGRTAPSPQPGRAGWQLEAGD